MSHSTVEKIKKEFHDYKIQQYDEIRVCLKFDYVRMLDDFKHIGCLIKNKPIIKNE